MEKNITSNKLIALTYHYHGGGKERVRDTHRERDREREKDVKLIFFETWPRLEPGPCPYMRNRLQLHCSDHMREKEIERERRREREKKKEEE